MVHADVPDAPVCPRRRSSQILPSWMSVSDVPCGGHRALAYRDVPRGTSGSGSGLALAGLGGRAVPLAETSRLFDDGAMTCGKMECSLFVNARLQLTHQAESRLAGGHSAGRRPTHWEPPTGA